jgi:hypothetical protein
MRELLDTDARLAVLPLLLPLLPLLLLLLLLLPPPRRHC